MSDNFEREEWIELLPPRDTDSEACFVKGFTNRATRVICDGLLLGECLSTWAKELPLSHVQVHRVGVLRSGNQHTTSGK